MNWLWQGNYGQPACSFILDYRQSQQKWVGHRVRGQDVWYTWAHLLALSPTLCVVMGRIPVTSSTFSFQICKVGLTALTFEDCCDDWWVNPQEAPLPMNTVRLILSVQEMLPLINKPLLCLRQHSLKFLLLIWGESELNHDGVLQVQISMKLCWQTLEVIFL